MFYLAELFHRLINNSKYCDWDVFSYKDILYKMMEKQPQNRFESFTAVKEAIGKHDFINMDISDEDKEIYQAFTNDVYQTISSYMEEPQFITDITTFSSRLKSALTLNLFESFIQDNSDIVRSVVTSGYRYKNGINISVETVQKFLDWFSASTPQSQILILNNFISKISSIRVVKPEPDLPF